MKQERVIDLTTVWLGKTVPDEIRLEECKLPDFFDQAGYLLGFYGFHARRAGESFCSYYAEIHGLRMVPINMTVQLDKPIASVMVTPELLPTVDFVNTARCSRAALDLLADFWYGSLETKGWTEEQLAEVRWDTPQHYMIQDESVVHELLAREDFAHLRLFAYPAKPLTLKTEQPYFTVGATKGQFVVAAESPPFPEIKIVLPNG